MSSSGGFSVRQCSTVRCIGAAGQQGAKLGCSWAGPGGDLYQGHPSGKRTHAARCEPWTSLVEEGVVGCRSLCHSDVARPETETGIAQGAVSIVFNMGIYVGIYVHTDRMTVLLGKP